MESDDVTFTHKPSNSGQTYENVEPLPDEQVRDKVGAEMHT